MRSRSISLVLAVLVLIAFQTKATVVTYTDKATFLAAAGAVNSETFSGASVGKFSATNSTFGPLAFNGFTLSGDASGNFEGIATSAQSGSPDHAIPAAFTGQNFLSWANIGGDTINPTKFTFGAGVKAFGFDWFNTDDTDQYTLALSTGDTYSGPPFTAVSGSSANSGFFGVISTTDLASASIQNNFFGGFVSDEGLDNVYTSASAPIQNAGSSAPLPAAVYTGLMGAAAAFASRRKLRTA